MLLKNNFSTSAVRLNTLGKLLIGPSQAVEEKNLNLSYYRKISI